MRSPLPPRALSSGARGPLHLVVTGLLVLLTLALAAPAQAATGNIDFVQPKGQSLQVLFSLADVPDGVSPDLGTVTVTVDGDPVAATAESVADSAEKVSRTTVIAFDASNSMGGTKFSEAKAAANVFLDSVPDDVKVGLVTFAGDVKVAQAPTTDHAAVKAAVDAIQLSQATRLYDGLIEATKAAGTDGARNLLVLSDGGDTSKTPLKDALKAVTDAKVTVNVVALAQNAASTAILQQIAEAGNGQVIPADDPKTLSGLFATEAEALAKQVLITVTPPAELAGKEGTMAVTVQVGGSPTTDEAFVSLPKPQTGPGGGEGTTDLKPAPAPGLQIPTGLMYGGIAAAGLGVMALIVVGLGGTRNPKQDAIDRSIEAYTRKGAQKLAAANRPQESQTVTQQAVAVADNLLQGQKGLEAALGSRLEAAGLSLKPAEWLLVHFGIAVGLGIAGILFGGGNLIFMLAGLFFGLVGPWFYLGSKKKRRLKAFKGQLADTLQLMAGALSAGLSLAQGVDTVVREGADPVAGEFRRALVETRLGVEIEDALSGVADRMQSVDFEWVVMAIRIQREVGGNLAELLNKVAETIREREYLERQVKTLSAEGRMSVWILGGLPIAFMGYLLMVNRSYVMPLFTNPIGWAMLVVMAVLLTVGIFWMSRVVKVEV